jgi:NAD(P)-dependent dehydrogenase (short-subunit alcohol dehydrogenase family)
MTIQNGLPNRRSALVTGATSGIGRELARKLAAAAALEPATEAHPTHRGACEGDGRRRRWYGAALMFLALLALIRSERKQGRK